MNPPLRCVAAAPWMRRGFLSGPRDQSTGKAHGCDTRRWERIVPHQDRVIEFRGTEVGEIACLGAPAKDGDVDDPGRDVEDVRAARFRGGFAVKQIAITLAAGREKLLVVGEAQLAVGGPDAAIEDEPVGAHEFGVETWPARQSDLEAKRVGRRFPHHGMKRLGLLAEMAQQVEVIRLFASKAGIRFKIDDSQVGLGLVGQT